MSVNVERKSACTLYLAWTHGSSTLKLCHPVQVTPRGVQLHLGTAAQPRLVDALVMLNGFRVRV